MNIGNLQIEAFKALVTGRGPVRYCADGDRVLITMDGFSGFSVPEKSLYINLNKVGTFDSMKGYFTLSEKDVPVKITKVFMNTLDGVLVRMKSEKFDVWIKKSFYEKYGKDATTAYCAGPREPVKFVGLSENMVESIVMPVRVREGWLDR